MCVGEGRGALLEIFDKNETAWVSYGWVLVSHAQFSIIIMLYRKLNACNGHSVSPWITPNTAGFIVRRL